ncbi:MAG TPA: hypothetical protein PKU91_05935, partial [Phycisphaerales bacterium]|nr:hypothetical protein [Phycisphaerales bacterium]
MPNGEGPADHDPAPGLDSAGTNGPPNPQERGMVEGDRACVACSYNLRGLPVLGLCPECGRPVMDSLRGILLEFASRDYVAKVGSGLWLVLNGILLMIVMWALTFFGRVMFSAVGVRLEGLALLVSVIGLGVSAMILFGYFRYSEPDPGFAGSERPDSARRVLRVAVIIQAAAAVIEFVMQVVLRATTIASPAVVLLPTAAVALSFIAWVVQFFAVMRYTEWLAKRVP